jgi:hypothetical protein
MRKIIVERGEVRKLLKLFGCSDQCVRNALRGSTESDLSQRIRKEALKRGGFYKPNRIKKELV